MPSFMPNRPKRTTDVHLRTFLSILLNRLCCKTHKSHIFAYILIKSWGKGAIDIHNISLHNCSLLLRKHSLNCCPTNSQNRHCDHTFSWGNLNWPTNTACDIRMVWSDQMRINLIWSFWIGKFVPKEGWETRRNWLAEPAPNLLWPF